MTSYAQLLGIPQFRVQETWYAPPLSKKGALLLYLASSGDWLSRDELLYIFYPDSAEKPARANLRQLLASLRRLPYAEGLETEDTRLRWQIETDVASFNKAIREEKWVKVLELYQGELLHGFNPPDLSEFDNWLALERQTLHAAWRKASLTFATELATTERYALAVEVLMPLHKADPLDEEVMRVYLESLYSSGQKAEALEVFATFRNTLHHELGSEPEGKTLELIGLIQGDKPLSITSSVAVKTRVTDHQKTPHNLPVQVTEFVGRDLEKTKLTALLAEKACRLITIVAPGGMGKTRLAIEVARTQLETLEQVCWVSFGAVNSSDLMVYTLADALQLNLFGAKPPREQVLDYLKNKKLLLVLDNLEHLLSGIDLIHDILTTAPKIKVLATSREYLGLQSEHLFDLYGLTVPNANSFDVHNFDALQLFAERTKHNRLEFVLEQHLQAVTRICQLVGGMPLAIELAASWSRLLTPSEIVGELEQNLDLLATSTRDLPDRHHSMRMVFEVSWQRLSEEEQTALRKLSVFQGGFTREAARAVAELDLPILLTLVNKSFVWRDTSGRFSQHPLILQYLRHKAKEVPKALKQVEKRHGLYFQQRLKERVKEVDAGSITKTHESFAQEFSNIRAAWDWNLREKRVADIVIYARDLNSFFEFNYSYEVAQMFKQTTSALDETNPKHHRALGYVLIYQAWHEQMSGCATETLFSLIERGIAFLEPLNEYEGVTAAQIMIGDILREQGDFAKAKEIFTQVLSIARSRGSRPNIITALSLLANVERQLGSFSEVYALLSTTLAEFRVIGTLRNLTSILVIFGSYLVNEGKLDEGEKYLVEGLDLARKTNYYIAPALIEFARLALKRQRIEQAEGFALEAFELLSTTHDPFLQGMALVLLARLKLTRGLLGETEPLLRKSLSIAWSVEAPTLVSHTLVFWAELQVLQGHATQGISLLSFLIEYPVILKRDRDEALKLLETARQQLSPRAFTQAQKESKSLKLEEIVTKILESGARGRIDPDRENSLWKITP